jgi:hypothetical protein
VQARKRARWSHLRKQGFTTNHTDAFVKVEMVSNTILLNVMARGIAPNCVNSSDGKELTQLLTIADTIAFTDVKALNDRTPW